VIHVRSLPDILRASWLLLAHWRPPRITVDTSRFPMLFAQRAQHRLAHLADGCNCLFGEVLAGTTLVLGLSAVWVFNLGWSGVAMILIVALGLLCIGKAIEAMWTRLRMLGVVLGLRRRLGSSADLPATKPASEVWTVATNRLHPKSLAGAAPDIQVPRSSRRKARRPKVVLGSVADINRLWLRVLAGWRLPRLEIRIDGLATPVAQRAQDRYTRISEGASFILCAVLATLTLLGGLANAMVRPTPDVDPIAQPELWIATLNWHNVRPVLLATLLAGIAGLAVEQVVIRLRLMGVLRKLKRTLNAVSSSSR
jgi:hypothetical protein